MGRSAVEKAPHCPEAVALRSFGAVLRELRRARGLSQQRLAERSGLHFTYISDVELGRRNVSLLTLVRLADGLDVVPAALAGGLTLRPPA